MEKKLVLSQSIQFKKITDRNYFDIMFKPPPEKVLFI